jgi:hypothetical protein
MASPNGRLLTAARACMPARQISLTQHSAAHATLLSVVGSLDRSPCMHGESSPAKHVFRRIHTYVLHLNWRSQRACTYICTHILGCVHPYCH